MALAKEGTHRTSEDRAVEELRDRVRWRLGHRRPASARSVAHAEAGGDVVVRQVRHLHQLRELRWASDRDRRPGPGGGSGVRIGIKIGRARSRSRVAVVRVAHDVEKRGHDVGRDREDLGSPNENHFGGLREEEEDKEGAEVEKGD